MRISGQVGRGLSFHLVEMCPLSYYIILKLFSIKLLCLECLAQLKWWARENHTSKNKLGMIQYHETLYSSRVIVALFLSAVLTMCSGALMNITWMKFGTPHSHLEQG